MNLLVLGPQGAGKGTQAKRISSRVRHPARLDRRHVPGGAGGRHRARPQVGEIMATGQLVPDELTIAMIQRAPGRRTMRAPGFVLDGFPRNLAQARGARRDARRHRPRARRDPLLRHPRRGRHGARAPAAPRSRTALDDTPRRDREAPRDLPLRDRADRRALPHDRQARAAARRGGRSTRSGPRSPTALDQVAPLEGAHDHPQVRSRRSRRWRAPAASSPRRSRCSRSTSSPASRRASSTRSPRSSSARTAACRRSRATRAIRPPPASRRTTWSCTGSRAPSKLADGDILSVDVGVTLDGFVADSAWTFAVGSISPEAQRLLDTCRAALEAGIEQAQARERDRRHLAGGPDGDRGRRLQRHPQPGRARGRAVDARGPAGAELRLQPTAARSSRRA